ncbi:MAG: type II secretion system protein [Kiritimatiellae bacterium]|jgi:prepilin-type N-terminal cleavage/methylation domain-containing protein|nr:type II secretion system protein [Kiritimatiellia bacterium]
MRRAFTIIELMMVVAIIAVLVTIIAVVATGAIDQARQHKAAAIRKVVQQGIDVYHAQKGDWPIVGLEKKSPNDRDGIQYILDKDEVRQCMRAILEECRQGNPMFDVSGLFVSRGPLDLVKSTYEEFYCAKYGLDFMSAIHGTKRTGRKMKLNEMWFGYPCDHKVKKTGITYKFANLKLGYIFASDHLEVLEPLSDDDAVKPLEGD